MGSRCNRLAQADAGLLVLAIRFQSDGSRERRSRGKEPAPPEGRGLQVVNFAKYTWLSQHGYSTSLRSQYVAAGWLAQPTRQVYQRPRGSLSWQQVVISLQTLLERNLIVGGRFALELKGFAHYLAHEKPSPKDGGTRIPWIGRIRDRGQLS